MSEPNMEGARPRPQYGEYASTEEQRRRIQQPDATWALESGQQLDRNHAQQHSPAEAAPLADDTAETDLTRRRRVADRVITIGLLVYGLFNVFTSIPLFTDYSAYAASLFEMMGLQATLSDPEGARAWGFAAAVVLGLGWLLTAVVSWMSMRRGRISWWIPLVGALVFSFASGILLTVPLFLDPGVWDVLVSGASS